MSIMISSDTKMKYLEIQKENLMKVRRTEVCVILVPLSCVQSCQKCLREMLGCKLGCLLLGRRAAVTGALLVQNVLENEGPVVVPCSLKG